MKRLYGLEWKGGSNVVKYCKDQDALRKIISEGLYNAISLFTKETPETNVSMMVADILEDYQHDSIDVIINAIKDIRKGKYKVYGLVTPSLIREAITDQLENQAIELERQHEKNKGYGSIEITERKSGRISDFVPKEIKR